MKVITFRADDKLEKYIDLICQKTKKRKSDVIRDLIVKGKVNNKTNKNKLNYELNRIGNNLNQIARHCNMKKVVDKEVFLKLIDIEKKIESLKNDL